MSRLGEGAADEVKAILLHIHGHEADGALLYRGAEGVFADGKRAALGGHGFFPGLGEDAVDEIL